jgi:hypothetical protein
VIQDDRLPARPLNNSLSGNRFQRGPVGQTIDMKIAVDREDLFRAKPLGRHDERGVSHVHGPILVLFHQLSHAIHLLGREIEKSQPPVGSPTPQRSLPIVACCSMEQVHRLGETRPGCYEWVPRQKSDRRQASRVVRVVTVDEGHKRAGVGQRHGLSRICSSASPSANRSPQRSERGSLEPSTTPTYPARKSARFDSGDVSEGDATGGANRRRRESRARSSGVVPCRRASSARGPSISAGSVIVVIRPSQGDSISRASSHPSRLWSRPLGHTRSVISVFPLLISSAPWLPAQDVVLPGSTAQGDILRRQGQFFKGAAWYEINAARARKIDARTAIEQERWNREVHESYERELADSKRWRQ